MMAISYVNFESVDPVRPLRVAGQFRVPQGEPSGRCPAVVIVHGSAGVDSRGSFYAEALNEAGMATLEIDMWAARGWLGGRKGRPDGVPETVPDAYGALRFLSLQPGIDPRRIGILGFSWGGLVCLLSATRPYWAQFGGEGLRFAAHVAHYPVCWVYNRAPGYGFREFTGAPVLIQAGELDQYDEPETCRQLIASLPEGAGRFISAKVYPGATHAWDRLEPAMTVEDPYAYLGRGGTVAFVPNPEAARESRATATRFFQEAWKG